MTMLSCNQLKIKSINLILKVENVKNPKTFPKNQKFKPKIEN